MRAVDRVGVQRDTVAFEFGTPVGGTVMISAQPADPTAAQFFLKVKMTP